MWELVVVLVAEEVLVERGVEAMDEVVDEEELVVGWWRWQRNKLLFNLSVLLFDQFDYVREPSCRSARKLKPQRREGGRENR